MTLAPVVRRTSTQGAAEQLFQLIKDGTWKVGDRLPSEKELAEHLGVGRSTVREALQNLSALNVIESAAGARTVIKAPSPTEIFRPDLMSWLIGDRAAAELLEARAMIEPSCARLASMRATDADWARVDAVLAAHAAALGTGGDVHEHGAAFHLEVVRCAGNRVAEIFMHSILDLLTARGQLVDTIPGARQRELDDHHALRDVLRARDPDAAGQAMLAHIRDWAHTYDGTRPGQLDDVSRTGIG
jgi:GntR family transcriptional regulator, transcriptional repressor for pyruvate dehydrogenase complex